MWNIKEEKQKTGVHECKSIRRNGYCKSDENWNFAKPSHSLVFTTQFEIIRNTKKLRNYEFCQKYIYI